VVWVVVLAVGRVVGRRWLQAQRQVLALSQWLGAGTEAGAPVVAGCSLLFVQGQDVVYSSFKGRVYIFLIVAMLSARFFR